VREWIQKRIIRWECQKEQKGGKSSPGVRQCWMDKKRLERQSGTRKGFGEQTRELQRLKKRGVVGQKGKSCDYLGMGIRAMVIEKKEIEETRCRGKFGGV